MMENKEYRSRQPGRRPMGHGPGSGGEKANDLIGTWKKLFDYCHQYKVVSVIALIGFVMLSGIIVNNGIVLVDYINQLRQQGITKYEAIVEAGKTRLRPIMMTALTTILGLIPMIVSSDSGSDMIRPMAIVTIGGLIYGTLLTLFVVPCIYAILNRKKDLVPELETQKKSEK